VATPDLAPARTTLHRVAAHVLGRRRHAVSGRFGLRASPGGFATPAFGEGAEVVRVAGTVLVHETAEGCASAPIAGSSLRGLAALVGADIDVAFSVGADTPEPGDVDAPLALDAAPSGVLAGWFTVGWRAIDAVVASLPAAAAPAVLQLWPEHFDAGTNVSVAGGQRCNLGVSPGDGAIDEPYAYVGPWGDERPGDAAYWNAPFGAVLHRGEAERGGDPVRAVSAFLQEGLRRLGPA
jgi:hypothetical protein